LDETSVFTHFSFFTPGDSGQIYSIWLVVSAQAHPIFDWQEGKFSEEIANHRVLNEPTVWPGIRK